MSDQILGLDKETWIGTAVASLPCGRRPCPLKLNEEWELLVRQRAERMLGVDCLRFHHCLARCTEIHCCHCGEKHIFVIGARSTVVISGRIGTEAAGTMMSVRAVAHRCARARSGAQAVQRCAGVVWTSEGHDDVRRFGMQAAGVAKGNSSGLDRRTWSEEDARGRSWNARWIGAGSFSLSFATSTIGVAYGKERVADRFAPKDVVLYQYETCPFCNKVKGRFFCGILEVIGLA